MHIPVKVDYGVRALVDLALHAEDQPIRASDIARRTRIPEPYLARRRGITDGLDVFVGCCVRFRMCAHSSAPWSAAASYAN